jgi:fibronectin-binding autotransporter adhesin
MGATVTWGSAAGNGTLLYLGPGESNARQFDLPSTGNGAIGQSGTGLLDLTGNFTDSGNAIHTLTLQGSGPGTGEVDSVISDNMNGATTNATSITKDGPGVWLLTANNNNTGSLTVRDGFLVVTTIGNSGVRGQRGRGQNVKLGGGEYDRHAGLCRQR